MKAKLSDLVLFLIGTIFILSGYINNEPESSNIYFWMRYIAHLTAGLLFYAKVIKIQDLRLLKEAGYD